MRTYFDVYTHNSVMGKPVLYSRLDNPVDAKEIIDYLYVVHSVYAWCPMLDALQAELNNSY